MRYVHDSALPAPYLCHIIHKDPPGEPKYFPFLRHSLSVPFVLFPYDARCSVNLILLRVTFLLVAMVQYSFAPRKRSAVRAI